MEHIAAFMLLIACDADLQLCREQPAPVIAYETVEQCERDLSPSLRMIASRADRVMGKCVEIDPALFYEDADLVWDVNQKGEIEVAIELINPELNITAFAQAAPQTVDRSSLN